MTSDQLAAGVRDADAAADRFLAGRHIPGVVYGVLVGGELVHVRGIGTLRVGEDARPDADSIFRIASMTKSFTAATILSLRDDGLLRLDDPVAAFVPELAGLRGPTADSPPISIRHLLTMTAGFPTDDPWGDRQQALDLDAFRALLRAGPSFAWTPGTRFEYSNLGYGILGRVVTAAAGIEYRDAVRARLLDPLEMSATTFLESDVPSGRLAHGYLWRDGAFVEEPIDGYGALAAMGGIFTSVRDLARWVAGFTDAFPPRDDPPGSHPLSRASRREMQQVHVAIPPVIEAGTLDAAPTVQVRAYGFGLFIDDDFRLGRVVAHSGGYPGFGSSMRWQPASGLGVIVLANHRYAPATLMATELLAALALSGAAPRRPEKPAPSTIRARIDVERLLEAWDDELATSIFAMNVDLDEPLALRRAAVDRIRKTHGRLTPDPDEPATSATPYAMTWWMVGELGGRVRIELLMSPESAPRIQALKLFAIPGPAHAFADAAASVVAWLNADVTSAVSAANRKRGAAVTAGRRGAAPAFAAALDGDGLARTIGAVVARYGAVTLGSVVDGSDGDPTRGAEAVPTVTFRLHGERGTLTLRLAMDLERNEIVQLDLRTEAQAPPTHGD